MDLSLSVKSPTGTINRTMKKLQITNTTEGKFIGVLFNWPESNEITLNGFTFVFDKTMQIPAGWRFISSNYIIDSKELIDGEDNK